MDPIEISAISAVPQLPKLKQHIKLNSLICAIYLSLLIGLLSLLLLIPSSPASSNMYYDLYFTHYFEPSKLLYFILLLYTGQLYTKSVTLKNYLKSSGRAFDSNTDIIVYCSFMMLGFVIAGNATLVAYNDKVSFISALLFDFCGYTLPYVLFLHITYVLSGVLVKVNLPIYELWKLKWRPFSVLLLIIGFIIGLLGYQCYMLYIYNRLYTYIIIYSLFCTFAAALFWLFRHKYQINDYFPLSFLLLPLTATPSLISAILQASLLGIFTESAVRVGFKNIINKLE